MIKDVLRHATILLILVNLLSKTIDTKYIILHVKTIGDCLYVREPHMERKARSTLHWQQTDDHGVSFKGLT